MMTAAQTKLSLVMIASGKQSDVNCDNFGKIPLANWADHSESGQTAVETFAHFLDFLRSHYNDMATGL
jgi:hypothetical protein